MALIPHDNNLTLVQNPDSTYDTAYAAGNKPATGPQVAVDAVAYAALMAALQNVQVPHATSINVRGVLSGPDKDTAVISIVTVSGDDAVNSGWHAPGGGNNLTNVGTAPAGGVFDLIATDTHGTPVAYPQTSWSFVNTSITADVLPPTVPTGIVVTPLLGSLQISMDSASDPYDAAVPGTSVDHYNVYDGTTKIAPSPVAQPTRPSVPRFTTAAVGAFSPSPAVAQTGQAWVVTAAGAGIHKVTSDECEFVGIQMSGDFSVALECDAFTSAYQYSTAGIMARESLIGTSVFVAAYVQPSTPGNGVQTKSRTVPAALSGNDTLIPGIAGPVRFLLQRNGDVFTRLYSVDGGQWQVADVKTVPMAQTIYVGGFVSSQNPGVPVTVTFHDLNFFAGPPINIAVPSTTTRTLSVTAVDKNNNESQKSRAVIATPLTSNPTGTKMWNPGIWVMLDNNQMSSNNVQFTLNRVGVLQTLLGDALKGILIFQNPKFFEGDTQGDFSGSWGTTAQPRGFAFIDPLLRGLQLKGLGLSLHWYTYGGAAVAGSISATKFPSFYCGQYLADPHFGANTSASDGIWGGVWQNTQASSGSPVARHQRWWTPNVMNDSIIPVMQGYSNQYDGLIERVSLIDESVVAGNTSYPSASAELAMLQQVFMDPTNGYFKKLGTIFKKTQGQWWGNFLQNENNELPMVASCGANKVAVGGPDIYYRSGSNPIPYYTSTQKAYRGLNTDRTVNSSAVDWAGKNCYVAIWEGADFTGSHGTVQQLWQTSKTLGAQYVVVYDNYGGPSGHDEPATNDFITGGMGDQLKALQASDPLSTTYPQGW